MYQTAHQTDGFNALRLNCINSNLPACAMIPNQQNFTRHDERFSFSTVFWGCQIGQVCVTFKSDQAQWFHLEVLSIQSRKSFKHFFCFHRTLGISAKDLEGFKADIALSRILPTPLVFISGYANTENVFYCLIIYYFFKWKSYAFMMSIFQNVTFSENQMLYSGGFPIMSETIRYAMTHFPLVGMISLNQSYDDKYQVF